MFSREEAKEAENWWKITEKPESAEVFEIMCTAVFENNSVAYFTA